MNINKYPEIKPGKKLLKRIYISIMMWSVGKAIEAAYKVDRVVREEMDKLPPDFLMRMIILPEEAFPLFFYAKMMPKFISERGRLLMGMQMILGKDKNGKIINMGSDPKGKKIKLHIMFRNLEAAFKVFSFQESTTTAYAYGRFVVEGDLPQAQIFVRILDIVETFLLPKFIVKLAVRRYPKWSEMSPFRKHLKRILVWARTYTA